MRPIKIIGGWWGDDCVLGIYCNGNFYNKKTYLMYFVTILLYSSMVITYNMLEENLALVFVITMFTVGLSALLIVLGLGFYFSAKKNRIIVERVSPLKEITEQEIIAEIKKQIEKEKNYESNS